MEKRSHPRIRDLVALSAFQGLDANESGCARISMMAREQKRSVQRAEYRCARPVISRSVKSGLHRTAGQYSLKLLGQVSEMF